MTAAAFQQDLDRLLQREGLLVRPDRGEGIEDVGYAEDPCRHGDLLPGEPVRVTAAVPVLVVVQHHRADVPGEVDIGEEFTNMIVVQRAYSAATKIISTADSMLEELMRTKR